MQKRGLFHFLACVLHTEPNPRGEGCYSELLPATRTELCFRFSGLDLML